MSHCSKKYKNLLGFMLFLAVLNSPAALAEDPAAADPAAADKGEYALKGADTCLKCHDESPANNIFQTPHAQRADARTPFASHDCETCHGASPDHVKIEPPVKGDKRLPTQIVFGNKSKDYPVSAAADQNKVCLDCHESGLRMHWRGSQHESADVPCSTCHTIHLPKDPVLVKTTQAEVCFECHTDKRAKMSRFSRHPVKEGKVVCSNCHNPHGGPGRNLVKNTVNETCFQCHAEKRGPYLWEHQPVRESCTVCHDPHGSTQPRMLVQKVPFLCMNCHSNWHGGPGAIPDAAFASRTYGRACITCHVQIHGSNHPSGPLLTR